MTKTNKSFQKRVRVTKKGKTLVRKPGGNHFNAKESRKNQLKRKRSSSIQLSNKSQGRFLPKK